MEKGNMKNMMKNKMKKGDNMKRESIEQRWLKKVNL